jgi:hypothetical protein
LLSVLPRTPGEREKRAADHLAYRIDHVFARLLRLFP